MDFSLFFRDQKYFFLPGKGKFFGVKSVNGKLNRPYKALNLF
jgi:hypothetical protein